MIKHDVSPVTVVTTCTRCPWWSAFSFSMDEAEQREIDHNVGIHEMNYSRASDAVRKRHQRARHAV